MEAENDFAAFETTVLAGEIAEEPAAPEAKEPLELTDADEAVEAEDGDDTAEEHTDAEGRKRRSKPAHMRIAELTARLRDAERKLAEKDTAPVAEVSTPKPKPNPDDFELGDIDPGYIDALTDWKIDTREAERAKVSQVTAAQQEFAAKINTGVVSAETSGKAKYNDFEAKVAAAVEARAGEPLPPLISVGIGLSPVGGDIIYKLATDEVAAQRIDTLAKGGESSANALAMALGEMEGEFMADSDDADLDPSDQLDLARMLGRMRARIKPAKPAATAPAMTNAPEPPEQRARGGSGKFEVGADTTDFAAFERKVMGKR